MLTCFWVTITLWQPKIDHVDLGAFWIDTHEEIVRFHVTVKEILGLHVFDAGDHLLTKHADSFEWEFARTVLEKVFKGLAQQFHDHAFVVAFDTVPVGLGNANY